MCCSVHGGYVSAGKATDKKPVESLLIRGGMIPFHKYPPPHALGPRERKDKDDIFEVRASYEYVGLWRIV